MLSIICRSVCSSPAHPFLLPCSFPVPLHGSLWTTTIIFSIDYLRKAIQLPSSVSYGWPSLSYASASHSPFMTCWPLLIPCSTTPFLVYFEYEIWPYSLFAFNYNAFLFFFIILLGIPAHPLMPSCWFPGPRSCPADPYPFPAPLHRSLCTSRFIVFSGICSSRMALASLL